MSGMGGGGMMPSHNTPGSSSQRGSGTRKRAAYDEQTIQSVTISQMVQSEPQNPNDMTGLMLPDGRKLYHVEFTAAVRSFEDNSTHVMYQMEDGTGGVMNVKKWLEDTTECTAVTELRRLCSKEAIYLKVVGQLKDYDGSKIVLADSIRPISTGNQLTHHFLQVVYQAELYKRGREGGNLGMGAASMGGFQGTPVMNRTPLVSTSNMHSGDETPLRQAVLQAFRVDNDDDPGILTTNVIADLKRQFPEEAIRNEINYLCGEGRLYSGASDDRLIASF